MRGEFPNAIARLQLLTKEAQNEKLIINCKNFLCFIFTLAHGQQNEKLETRVQAPRSKLSISCNLSCRKIFDKDLLKKLFHN